MIQKFENYLRSIRGYSENTVRAYSTDLHTFATWARNNVPGCKWSKITRADIDRYITDQQHRGLKPSTTNRHLAALSSLYRYFQREGLLTINPCQYESRRKLPQTIPATIPVEQIKRAYERSQGATKMMLGLLATTGIRIQELLDLRYRDINTIDGTLHITGKGSKERIVSLDPSIMQSLRAGVERLDPHMKIFYVSQREARYRIYEALRPYSNSPKLSPHVIRHTFATELAKNGESTATIAKVLGHAHIETSQKYIDMAQVPSPHVGICLT